MPRAAPDTSATRPSSLPTTSSAPFGVGGYRNRHACTVVNRPRTRASARPTDRRGSGAALLVLRMGGGGEWLPDGVALLPLQRSHIELLAFWLPGPTGDLPSAPASPVLRAGNLCVFASAPPSGSCGTSTPSLRTGRPARTRGEGPGSARQRCPRDRSWRTAPVPWPGGDAVADATQEGLMTARTRRTPRLGRPTGRRGRPARPGTV